MVVVVVLVYSYLSKYFYNENWKHVILRDKDAPFWSVCFLCCVFAYSRINYFKLKIAVVVLISWCRTPSLRPMVYGK